MRRLRFLLVLIAGATSGCVTSTVLVPHAIELVPPEAPVPEEQLLDIGVSIFEPGVPEGEVDKEVLEELYEQGVFVQIRRAESIYMATQLRDTLQRAGHWGAVWATPKQSLAADLNVTAKIEHSDGHIVRVHVTAVDATGREWIDKPYERELPATVYNRRVHPNLDPYQDLFNSIANDLAAVRHGLGGAEAREIRTVAALRYAGELSGGAFGRYVAADGEGLYEVVRLPAVDDPMFDRTRRVRQRERIFLETLNQRYDEFATKAGSSYDSWRQFAREEAVAVQDLTRGARWRKALGLATMVASVATIGNGGGGIESFAGRAVRDSLMLMSAEMLQASATRLEERRLHGEALEELSTSFDEEVEPLVVEIAGEQRRLEGTAEVQYAEWRELLRQLLLSETGFAPEEVVIHREAIR